MKAIYKENDTYMYYGEMRSTDRDKFCGKGYYIHKSNGLFHEGWYENSMFNGYGRHVKDHAVYDGFYKDDKYDHGQMTVYESREDIFEVKYTYLGEYTGGAKRQGMGLYLHPRGDMYYGFHE